MNTPTMQPGTVEMVSVEWIMKNAKHSVDGFTFFDMETNDYTVDYEEMLYGKALDSHFGDVVGAILDKGFRVPIVMLPDYRNHGLTHGNGHHRMSAAILLCLDEIPVYWSESDYMSEEHSDTEELGDYSEWNDLPDELGDIFFG